MVRSGLHGKELARIQPTYTRFDPLNTALVALLLALTPFAVTSIVLNARRLATARMRSLSIRTAAILGPTMILLYAAAVLHWLAVRPDSQPEPPPGQPPPPGGTTVIYWIDERVLLPLTLAFPVAGIVCLVQGLRRGRRSRQAAYDAYNSGADLF